MSVTVIIPNYNNAPFLTQCLDSVRADDAVQSIIIYDNASQDGSVELIERMAEPKIVLIRGEANLGATRARHHAVQLSTTEYIQFLDGDDFLDPGTVQAGYAAARDFDLDFAIPDMMRVNLDGGGRREFIIRPTDILDGDAAFMMTLGGWKIHPMGVMRRKTYLKAARRFDFHGFSDDEILTCHLFLHASRVGGCAGAYNYRIVDKPVTSETLVGRLRTEIRMLALAVQSDIAGQEAFLRRLRNSMVRALVGLLRRTAFGPVDWHSLRSLHAEFARIDLPWRLADRPYQAAASIVSLSVKAGWRHDG
jgi:glycosyltransferase involved in cell wall biosynthesis